MPCLCFRACTAHAACHSCLDPRAAPARTVAPEGSGRTARLLGAGSRRDAAGELYYWQEFTVQSDTFYRHNLAGKADGRSCPANDADPRRVHLLWHGVESVRRGLPQLMARDRSAALPSPAAAVYAARNGLLYTLNAQCPEEWWAADEAGFRRTAESFTILNSGAATAGFPDRL